MNSFEAAVLDMAAAGYQERSRLARERHLHTLVKQIDNLVGTLEVLQASGRESVPAPVRAGAGRIVSEVALEPDFEPPADSRPADLIEVLFEAQDEVLTQLHPGRRTELY